MPWHCKRAISFWCTYQRLWLFTAKVRGTQYAEADRFSREFVEWKLLLQYLEIFVENLVCISNQWPNSKLYFMQTKPQNHSNWCIFIEIEHSVLLYFSSFSFAEKGSKKNTSGQLHPEKLHPLHRKMHIKALLTN